MVDDDRYCVDVLHQLSAVQGALDRVRRDVLDAHLRGCLPEALSEGHIDHVIDELLAAAFGPGPRSQQEMHHCQAGGATAGAGA